MINKICMAKILNFKDEIGCEVLLLDSNVTALLPISEFSKKKIKKSLASYFNVDDEVPVMISQLERSDAGITFIIVSTKDVSDTEALECKSAYESNQKLLHMCKRMVFLSGKSLTEEQWQTFFDAQIKSGLTYDILSNREQFTAFTVSTKDWTEYFDVINTNYTKLFGIQTTTCTGNLTIQCFSVDGNEIVQKELTKVMKKFQPMEKDKVYSKDELYTDDTRFNIDLRLVLPTFHVVVTAYNKSLCHDVITRFCKAVQSRSFDHCQWQIESS